MVLPRKVGQWATLADLPRISARRHSDEDVEQPRAGASDVGAVGSVVQCLTFGHAEALIDGRNEIDGSDRIDGWRRRVPIERAVAGPPSGRAEVTRIASVSFLADHPGLSDGVQPSPASATGRHLIVRADGGQIWAGGIDGLPAIDDYCTTQAGDLAFQDGVPPRRGILDRRERC